VRTRDRTPSLAIFVLAILLFILAFATSATAATVSRWGSYLAGFGGAGPSETQTQPAPAGLSEVTIIDASNSSSYALRADGSVWAWGNGTVGQLGDGKLASSSTPVRVVFPKGIVIKTIGESKNAGYAIDSAGEAWAWGQGTADCLQGRVRSEPVKITGLTNLTEVQGGENHVLWLERDGMVLGCGANGVGQLGLGKGVGVAKSPTVITGLKSIVQISAGDRTLEARDSSGQVFMSGENTRGQVGVGSSEAAIWTPMQVPLPEPATSISAGGDLAPNGTNFAMTAKTLYGWGYDGQGQVGDRQTAPRLSPVDTGLHFASVAAGGTFVLGLDKEGNLYSWGRNAGGDLGIGRPGGTSFSRYS
jgi:alpha-tubulin suppressor-like RCC1 family protein